MAKKRVSRKPNSKKRPIGDHKVLKLIGGLAGLVLVVLGAGILVDTWMGRAPEQTRAAVKPSQRYQVPPVRSSHLPAVQPPAERPSGVPVYEIFPRNHIPETKPVTPVPQFPDDQPPMAAIIIDDVGYDRRLADLFMSLDLPLTLSLLPQSPFSRTIQKRAQSRGLETMLHLPMEPNEYPDVQPGPGALLSGMTPDELIAQLDQNIEYFGAVKGVNNHMGSRISSSSEQMRQIFSILKKRGLYYVDSRTTSGTVARQSARLLQLPFAERDIFIDHENDPAFIRSQLQRLVRRARQQGYAIAIGHPHENTYQVLKEMLPHLKQQLTVVPASMIVQRVMLAQAARPVAVR